ncbi:hypothetical protein H310_12890 [Aphanomyces invadans]|uniref:MYND-type domain-containing protein n=1 Tax=Aphanomyces invadans TaxID=157072 RepID=A0A024TFZ7_9STRA|nr:hypothetical protein H310_12890 [Aphanomyces invadans]ETV93095.1 hypothetical protein H310_12890 [Aphanomyces invadans]|eukprot:XP_008878360.1 hypothetical protein H310_12890 [Aphanomyces invadans]
MAANVVVPAWGCVAPVLCRLDDAELVKVQRPARIGSEAATEWIPLSKDIAPVASSARVPGDNLCLHTAAAPLGRMAATTVAVDVGDVVFATPAFAVALSRGFVASHCHMCLTKLRGRVVQCADCKVARYCDRDCMRADIDTHTIECDALVQLAPIRSNDPDAAAADLQTRLVLAVLAMEVKMQNPFVIQDLTTYSLAKQDEADYLAVAKTLLGAIKRSPAWMTSAHVLDVYRAVRFNAHPIVVDLASPSLGLGLFPDAAKMFNHSCAPTAFPCFNIKTHALEFRAVTPLLPGTLVSYSYLDVLGYSLLQPKPSRQRCLQEAFEFACQCSRCFHEPDASDQTNVVDAWLADLDLAQQRHDWTRLIDLCHSIMTHWTATLGLPETYPLMYVLQKKIDLAAAHVPHAAPRAPCSVPAADHILRVCGLNGRPAI